MVMSESGEVARRAFARASSKSRSVAPEEVGKKTFFRFCVGTYAVSLSVVLLCP